MKKLMLRTPIVKDAFVGKNANQRAQYILLPDNYENDLLANDVKNGASLYKPLLEEALYDSRYTIIGAKYVEDGLRAVVYHASRLEADNYHEEGPQEFIPSERGYCDEYSIDDIFDGCDKGNEYEEDYSRIPIIDIAEIERYNMSSNNRNGGFGAFGMELNTPMFKEEPWWIDCMEENVCIVVNDSCGDIFGGFIGNTERISETAMQGLKRFSRNNHVYILVVSAVIDAIDFSINRAMIEFSADFVKLNAGIDEYKDYHHTLLKEVVREYGMSLSKKIDSKLLAEKLATVNVEYPCSTYEKVIKYISERTEEKRIEPKSFEKFGLAELINLKTDTQTKKPLEDLYGMESVKNQFESILNSLRYNKKREENKLKPLDYHKTFVFLGAPGTAKTTAAKALTDIMANEQLISGNRFISISGAQLKGAYVGQTAPKIHALFNEHDAIFIDEAYSLTSDQHGEIDMYAQEALAQLAIELEEHATDKLIIFAGYGGKNVSKNNNKMKFFLDANPGIKSRITSTVFFDSYSADEMVNIVHHLSKKAEISIEESSDSLIKDYFDKRGKSEDFGNGREARSFLEECQKNIANRVMISGKKDVGKEELLNITKEDVSLAIDNIIQMNEQQMGVGNKPGYLLSGDAS